ncbi:CPBP family intramembrane glutamic endopeptidase [Caulobacter sp. 17J80-11]|uniref:CPBP family intramembrane glutamic endopeptidase n=1 Tax=Caulobacter sp. 17J80-11 TaxID=2763502 RepID=UPI0016539FE2|nr:CPBP family intramembrane glutamic endopeptidase [Caulobacter sp. 17J80-11]MBC6980215.1 CPBP family intramembrane metalloprotease [Caulobacter sp. 17J80-11]
MTTISLTPPASTGRRWLVALAALAVFILVDSIGLIPFGAVAGDLTGVARTAALAVVGYGLYLALPLALAAALFGPRAAPGALGLNGSVLAGIAVGVAGTAVMLAGFALTAPYTPPEDPFNILMRRALLPGIAEEILYRALLFGFLFRFARWGFLPAALVGAAFFGAAHLYQGDTPTAALEAFLMTGLGAVWFAWLYAEWRFNLWVPIAFHVLMNGMWELFTFDEAAFSSATANALRLAVIVVSVVITVAAARRRGGRVVCGKAWLWGGPAD